MDINLEEKFVQTFCEKRIRDRIIYELKNAKKRKDCIGRFCHNTDTLIKQSYILQTSNKWTIDDLISIIEKISKSNKCYIIAFDDDIDGKVMSLIDGIQECFYRGMATIIIIDEKTSIIKAEQSFGASQKYILHQK
jgi:rRNA-processing protein FCF1